MSHVHAVTCNAGSRRKCSKYSEDGRTNRGRKLGASGREGGSTENRSSIVDPDRLCSAVLDAAMASHSSNVSGGSGRGTRWGSEQQQESLEPAWLDMVLAASLGGMQVCMHACLCDWDSDSSTL